MNIYATSSNAVACARYLDDRRVVTQLSETIQLLSNALYFSTFPKDLRLKIYSPLHVETPCSIWTRKSRENYLWLLSHLEELKRIHREILHNTTFANLEAHIDIFRAYAEHILVGIGLTKHANHAFSRAYGFYYDDMDDVYKAYRLYLHRLWAVDKIPPVWTGRFNPME